MCLEWKMKGRKKKRGGGIQACDLVWKAHCIFKHVKLVKTNGPYIYRNLLGDVPVSVGPTRCHFTLSTPVFSDCFTFWGVCGPVSKRLLAQLHQTCFGKFSNFGCPWELPGKGWNSSFLYVDLRNWFLWARCCMNMHIYIPHFLNWGISH